MRRSITTVLAALGIALFVTAVRAAEEQYPNITIDELKAHLQSKDVTVLDANGTQSYQQGHIPGALDFDTVASNLEKVLPTDKNALIVAYCGGPQCPLYKAAAAKAVAMGYTNVKHLSAGISGWKSAGEKIEKSDNAG